MSFGHHSNTILLVLLLSLLSACGQGTVDSERDPVYFSPLESQDVEPKVHEDPGPAMSATEREQIQPVVEGFRRNARQVLAKPDIGERISQIESIFIASGHIFELARIYQDIVEDEGVSSPAAPRLAWILLQLGQEKQARMWIDRLLVEYPGRASSWYLDAIYTLPRMREDARAPARMVYSWNRSQGEATTDLIGFGQRQTKMVGQQAARIEEQLPRAALDAVEADLAELLATPLSELETPPALASDAREEKQPQKSDAAVDEAPAEGALADETAAPEAADTPDRTATEKLTAQDIQKPTPPVGQNVEKREPLKITIARGTIALSNGNAQKAMRVFQTVLQRDPDNVEAKLGMARAGWADEEMRNQSASVIRELAGRDDLTPRQTYEIGLFAFSKMDDDPLAERMWERVAEEDPELAKRVGLEEMLQKVRR